MARYKLRQYQDSYGVAMKPFGLERGIVGSKAHHKTAMQFMREEEVDLQTNIEKLLDECVAQQEELHALTDKKQQLENEKASLEVVVKKQKKEKKATQAGFTAKVMNVLGAGDLAKANATIEEKNKEIDNLNKKIVAWQNKYKTDSAAWNKEKQSLMQYRRSYIRLMNSNSELNNKYVNERYERAILRDNVDMLLDQFNSPTLAPKLIEVAYALLGGNPVLPSSVGGGSASSSGWSGKKDDEDDNAFRRRAFIHAAKLVHSVSISRTRGAGLHR